MNREQTEAIKMAREVGAIHIHGKPKDFALVGNEHLERFAALVAAAEREACLNCYSPDDTATDWADKIRARGETK